ncbi:MAG: hypothetical protein EBR82_74525 [Caulobacteraceae bacterium]|jgi:hypothetical protein|nr:hypothetical protein [Caulobacteraceae bacterium]
MPTNTEKLFNDATTLVHERGVVYGHAIYNMQRISKSVSAYIDFPIMPHDIPIINVLQKISRLAESPGHEDSIVDIIAYMAIYKMCIDAETDGEFEFREGE